MSFFPMDGACCREFHFLNVLQLLTSRMFLRMVPGIVSADSFFLYPGLSSSWSAFKLPSTSIYCKCDFPEICGTMYWVFTLSHLTLNLCSFTFLLDSLMKAKKWIFEDSRSSHQVHSLPISLFRGHSFGNPLDHFFWSHFFSVDSRLLVEHLCQPGCCFFLGFRNTRHQQLETMRIPSQLPKRPTQEVGQLAQKGGFGLPRGRIWSLLGTSTIL